MTTPEMETDEEKLRYLNDFGQIFIPQVRDCVLEQNITMLTQSRSRLTGDRAFARELSDEQMEALVRYTRSIVDQTCHHFLYFLSNYQFRVVMPPLGDNEKAVDVARFADELYDGLPYCYPSEGGWVQKFSVYLTSEYTER